MAKQAIASGLEGLNVSGVGMLDQAVGASVGYATDAAYSTKGDYDPLEWHKRELADFIGQSAADLARQRIETHVSQLDPDIACMQSIALQAKIRMQRDRNFERNRSQQRGWLERQLQDAIKRIAS